MWRKNPIYFLTLLLFMFVLLIGCSNNEDNKSGTNSGDNSGGKQSDDSEVTLVWWSHDGPAFVAANKKFIADYEEANPNVKIDLQVFPYDAMIQKLKAAYAGKNAPDIAQVFGSWVAEYARGELLAEVPQEDSEWVKENFYEPSLGGYSFDDKLFGIPHEYNLENGGMLAHPGMFEEANVEYPENWDQLIEVAQALTVRDGDKIKTKGFEFISNDSVMFTLLSMILQQDGTYLTDDGLVDFSTPEAVTAMEELKKFITEYKVTDLQAFGGTESHELFFKDQAATVVRGPWTIGVGREDFDRDDFDYISLPPFTDNSPYFAAESGWGEIVAKQSEHKEEAWDFVRFMVEQDQAKYFNLTTNSVPANINVAEDPSFLEEAPMMKVSLDILPYGQFIGEGIDIDYFKKQVNDNFQLFVSDKISAEDGLKNIEESVNKSIERK